MPQIKNEFPGELIYLAIGGFHLHMQINDEKKSIINKMSEMGILKAAPCHCSGNNARKLFKNTFKDNYVEIGTGKIIYIN